MINIFSETGTLQEVLMHYPGNEFHNFSILNKKQSLYDEIPNLKKLQEEHLNFQQKLIENNVKVFLVKDLLIEVLTANEVKKSFIEDFLLETKIKNSHIINETRKYLNSLETDHLVEKIISGVLWSDISIKEKKKVFVTLPMINLLYQRDPFTAIKNSAILNNTSMKIRKNESLLLDYILKFHKKFKVNTKKINNNFKIEGGDILILNKDLILIGVSERTSYQAVKQLADFIINELKFKKILAVKIPKERRFMHLDTILTPVDNNKFVVYEEVIKHLNIWKIEFENFNIKISQEKNNLICVLQKEIEEKCYFFIVEDKLEQWNDAANVLAIAPNKIIAYDINQKTNNKLKNNGIEVIEINSSELSKGRGGTHCLTMPTYRAEY